MQLFRVYTLTFHLPFPFLLQKLEKSKTNTLQATNNERNQKETKKGTPEQAIREKRTANVKNMEEKCLGDSFHAF